MPEPVRDLALLLTRALLGVVLVAHGWDKLVDQGVSGTADVFASLGVPLPEVAAVAVGVLELGGGVLLVLGAATAVVAVLVLLDMAGAFWLVHRGNGVLVDGGGWELVAVVAAGALALLGAGPGRASLDHLVDARRSRSRR